MDVYIECMSNDSEDEEDEDDQVEYVNPDYTCVGICGDSYGAHD
jgi:hypothetical protein